MNDRMNEIINTLVAQRGQPMLLCAPASQQSDLVNSLYAEVGKRQVLNPTGRNHTDVVHMSLYSGNEPPDHFTSLAHWARALFAAAGYRDQFEGLVMLNIAGVKDKPRLRAVAEGIETWCRRSYVVLYGYEEKDPELMSVINTLDLYGTLRVACIEQERNVETDAMAEIDRRGYNISLAARKRLSDMLAEVSNKPGFTMEKYFNALGVGNELCGSISAEMLTRITNDPFSYHNRLRNDGPKSSRRRIGFGAAEGGREASVSL